MSTAISKIAVQLEKDGRTIALDANDCLAVVRALARTGRLTGVLLYVPPCNSTWHGTAPAVNAIVYTGPLGDESIRFEVDCEELDDMEMGGSWVTNNS